MNVKWSIINLLLVITFEMGKSDFHITQGLRCYHCKDCTTPTLKRTDENHVTCPDHHKCYKEYGMIAPPRVSLAFWITRSCINQTEEDAIKADDQVSCDDNFDDDHLIKKCICDTDFCNEASLPLRKFNGTQFFTSVLMSLFAYFVGSVFV
ncbi:unnamed protein product [Orchesella dallaii]|uniref:Protein quiver n=1 Tax=Orchesella dallaii TaxID=48710 RepID=A0ABP1Q4Z6_9HEXA